MNATKIDWVRNPPDNETQGFTLNPTGGCSGNGCAVYNVCYARRTAKRFKQRCGKCYSFEPHYHMERLNQLKELKRPSGIFIGSMSDIFDDEFNHGYIMTKLYDVFSRYRQHRFYLLTKQPQNAMRFSFMPNVWFGVTINRRSDLWRLDALRQINAEIRFVSFEPLMEDLGDINLENIDWIILGAQTRPAVQPPKYAVELILSAVRPARIPVFMKANLLEFHGYLKQEFPEI